MFPLLRDTVDQCVLVSEADVKTTVRRLALGNKLVVEPSAALATAAALAMTREQHGRAVCLVTGGSIDASKLAAILTEQA
jgi:threonine dehydratase